MENRKIALRVENATRLFGSLRAVDGLSFDVYEGEIFGIAGPNGSGKTTLMNIITQVIPPNAGSIFFHDIPIHKKSAHRICHEGIGRTFQNPTVFESLSIMDNMIIGSTFGKNHNRTQKDLEKIHEILDFVNLEKPLDTRAGKLLVNDKKKLMIAIALIAGPRLLILDEPCAGLNTSESKESIELIKKIGEKGITVMLIEHNMSVLMNISDRVMIMDAGKKLCLGPPSHVCRNETVIEKYLGKSTAEGVKHIAEN
jgi:branched-chain amino acid transport system ATP-binding protein